MNRRNFVISAAAAGSRARAAAASDKVNVAIIGVRGRGKALADEFAVLPEARVACFVDADDNVLARIASSFEEKYGARPKLHRQDLEVRRRLHHNPRRPRGRRSSRSQVSPALGCAGQSIEGCQ